jgi:hypothetical protein
VNAAKSFTDLVIIMVERGISLAHTTILRWVQHYLPEFEKRWKRYARPVGRSWRMARAVPVFDLTVAKGGPKREVTQSEVALRSTSITLTRHQAHISVAY